MVNKDTMNFELEDKYGVQGLCDKMQDGLEVPLSFSNLVIESVKKYYDVELVQRDDVVQRKRGFWIGQPHDGKFVTLTGIGMTCQYSTTPKYYPNRTTGYNVVRVDGVKQFTVNVGVSSAATTGNGGGLSGMNQMCDDTYPGSRMCTTKDLVSNGFPSSIPFNKETYGYARVHNDSNILAVTMATSSGKNYFQYEGWIPREDRGDDKCLEWRLDDSSYTHSVIYHHMNDVPRPSNTSCADQIPNACCK